MDKWKEIPEWPEYYANESGEILSTKQGRRQLLKPFVVKGYKKVNLCRDGIKKHQFVHRLVWSAFNGCIPDGMIVCHGEGNDRLNSSLKYLSLGTTASNLGKDRRRDGTTPKGENNPRAKLTCIQIEYIRDRYRDGMKARSLASLFNVSYGHIHKISRGESWSFNNKSSGNGANRETRE